MPTSLTWARHDWMMDWRLGRTLLVHTWIMMFGSTQTLRLLLWWPLQYIIMLILITWTHSFIPLYCSSRLAMLFYCIVILVLHEWGDQALGYTRTELFDEIYSTLVVREIEAGRGHLLDFLVQWRRFRDNGHGVGVRTALLHLLSVLLEWLFDLS